MISPGILSLITSLIFARTLSGTHSGIPNEINLEGIEGFSWILSEIPSHIFPPLWIWISCMDFSRYFFQRKFPISQGILPASLKVIFSEFLARFHLGFFRKFHPKLFQGFLQDYLKNFS